MADLQNSPGVGSEVAQAARVGERCGERLFQKDVSAVLESATCRLRVEGIGNRDVNGITPFEQFLFGLGQRAVQFFCRFLSPLRIDVEHPGQLNPAIAAQNVGVRPMNPPPRIPARTGMAPLVFLRVFVLLHLTSCFFGNIFPARRSERRDSITLSPALRSLQATLEEGAEKKFRLCVPLRLGVSAVFFFLVAASRLR